MLALPEALSRATAATAFAAAATAASTGKSTFTQDQVNKFLAEDRRKNEARLKAEKKAELEKISADFKKLSEHANLTETERDEYKTRLKMAGVNSVPQRYKGLGEMNADQLADTTMSPVNRVLLKVNVEDAEKADAIFNKLMGEEVMLRKNFITSYANSVDDSDLDI